MTDMIPMASVDPIANARAKDLVRQKISWPTNLTPANVTYHSQGHGLVVVHEADTAAVSAALGDHSLASCTFLVLPDVSGELADTNAQTLTQTPAEDSGGNPRHLIQSLDARQAANLLITGYLGAFHARLMPNQTAPERSDDDDAVPLELSRALINRDAFDMVLDLTQPSRFVGELAPPGYITLDWQDSARRGASLEAFTELVGEFDKPRYFQVNSDLCAHASGASLGCTRCLEVCPAEAISSRAGRVEPSIEIDPYLCQGVGSCTSACPTGAIEFRLPDTRRQQDTLGSWLAAYREAGGTCPVLRFVTHDSLALEGEHGVQGEGHVLDIPLEELGAAGHDQWLGGIVAGAAEIRVQYHADMPPRLTRFLASELDLARALLLAAGHSPDRIQAIDPQDEAGRDALPGFAPLTDQRLVLDGVTKRDRFNQVLEHLFRLGQPSGQRESVAKAAPYGGIEVSQADCTLCMACVSTCPTAALQSGGKAPELSFREADCVQCGLCEMACPEQAMTLVPGFLASPQRFDRLVCHQDTPFECIECGKPFATRSTVHAIQKKLAEHPYFAGEARARLEMCEDCRVKDVWQAMARDPAAQLKV